MDNNKLIVYLPELKKIDDLLGLNGELLDFLQQIKMKTNSVEVYTMEPANEF